MKKTISLAVSIFFLLSIATSISFAKSGSDEGTASQNQTQITTQESTSNQGDDTQLKESEQIRTEENTEAQSGDVNETGDKVKDMEQTQDRTEEQTNTGDGDKVKEKVQDKIQERQQLKKDWETSKDELAKQGDALKVQLKSLEEQLDAAEKSGDTAKAAELKVQIQTLNDQQDSLKTEMKQLKTQYNARIMNEFKEKIKNNGASKNLEVLNCEKVKIKGTELDSDTPPVIREGRTLIPLRAIVSALGADVKWDEASKTVTITRDAAVITINTQTNATTVNGKEVTMDSKCDMLANRTYVPFRFIAVSLGDKVDYNKDTGEISIGE